MFNKLQPTRFWNWLLILALWLVDTLDSRAPSGRYQFEKHKVQEINKELLDGFTFTKLHVSIDFLHLTDFKFRIITLSRRNHWKHGLIRVQIFYPKWTVISHNKWLIEVKLDGPERRLVRIKKNGPKVSKWRSLRIKSKVDDTKRWKWTVLKVNECAKVDGRSKRVHPKGWTWAVLRQTRRLSEPKWTV